MPPVQDLPLPDATAAPDEPPPPSDSDRRAVRGAIELVASGVASRIVLVGLDAPSAAAVELGTEATVAAVPLRIDEDSNDQIVVIAGPRGT